MIFDNYEPFVVILSLPDFVVPIPMGLWNDEIWIVQVCQPSTVCFFTRFPLNFLSPELAPPQHQNSV